MALVNTRATVDLTPLIEVNQLVVNAPVKMQKLQALRAFQSTRRVRILLAAPEDLPALPFIWSNDPAAQARARRWYFANKVPKGSKGGRYQRTGQLEAGNEVVFTPQENGGQFDFLNPANAFKYVYGDRQVPSHYLTGWPQEDKALEPEVTTLRNGIIDDWFTVNSGGD